MYSKLSFSSFFKLSRYLVVFIQTSSIVVSKTSSEFFIRVIIIESADEKSFLSKKYLLNSCFENDN
jgi:hypothetical protein